MVLPILHLIGYKIANPAVRARIGREELEQILLGYGYNPHFVEGHEPEEMHRLMAATHDRVVAGIAQIQSAARIRGGDEAAARADDRPEDAQGVDRAEGRRWPAGRGDVPGGLPHGWRTLLAGRPPPVAKSRFNVVDLMKLQPEAEHPHGLSVRDFDALFPCAKPVIFAYHGYLWLIHRRTWRRTNHINLHVRGDKEEGTITTPFDMAVLNDLDRFHLESDVQDRLPQVGRVASYAKQAMRDKLTEHRR